MVDLAGVHGTRPAVAPAAAPGDPSVWAPLRRPWFRALWLAQFAGNVGTWAHTVAAQWLMGALGGAALPAAAVQPPATPPVFRLGVPPGALGGVVDRRRLLLLSQGLMLA